MKVFLNSLLILFLLLPLSGLGYQISELFDADVIRLNMRGLCCIFIAIYVLLLAGSIAFVVTFWQ